MSAPDRRDTSDDDPVDPVDPAFGRVSARIPSAGAPETSDDAVAEAILRSLGARMTTQLGRGGEGIVYPIDDERVVKIYNAGAQDPRPRHALVAELSRRVGSTPTARTFRLPAILEVGVSHDRWYSIERRLGGTTVADALERLVGDERTRLIQNQLDAVAALGDLPLDDRGWFGDLAHPDPIRADTWIDFCRRKIEHSLEHAPGFGRIDASRIVHELPACDDPSFVHLDAFVGNILCEGSEVTAVIDIGATSTVGDRRFDPVSAVVYLHGEGIRPAATEHDKRTAAGWLADAGLSDMYEPVRRWLAAYWAWAIDDEDLHHWCRSVLL